MKKFVADASVAIKWFIPEIHSAAASRFLDPAIVVLAPDLIVPELGNTLWKKVGRGEISRENASEILVGFRDLDLEIVSSVHLISPAFDLAVALERSVYDCLYLALAVAQDCALVTADRKFHTVISATGLAEHIRWVDDPSI